MLLASSSSSYRSHSHPVNIAFGQELDQLTVCKYKQIIAHSLDHNFIDNALFFAERLKATVSPPISPTTTSSSSTSNGTVYSRSCQEEANLILAKCYFRKGKFRQSYAILKDWKSPASRFLFAQCCEQLNMFLEGEASLLNILSDTLEEFGSFGSSNFPRSKKSASACSMLKNVAASTSVDKNSDNLTIDNASVFCLLGKLCRKSNRISQAIEYFERAVDLNPFLWEAFEELCAQGIVPDDFNFSLLNIDNNASSTCYPWLKKMNVPEHPDSTLNVVDASFGGLEISHRNGATNPSSSSVFFGGHGASSTNSENIALFGNNNNNHKTPSNGGGISAQNISAIPARKKQRLFPSEMVSSHSDQQSSSNDYPPLNLNHLQHISKGNHSNPMLLNISSDSLLNNNSPVRRSTRLNVGTSSNTNILSRGSSSSLNVKKRSRPCSSANKMLGSGSPAVQETNPSPALGEDDNPSEEIERCSLNSILDIVQTLGRAYSNLSKFKSKVTIEILNTLPSNHFNTGFVLHCMARAHFELVDYRMRMRLVEPYRISGLELYSTLLWHLQKESQLSFLAKDLVQFDRKSPQTWCAVGNCFSLQKDHDSALRCFQRAIQLDPFFSYAFTLSGHEHVSNEDFEKAAICFRNAIRVDSRHYNAWYGLGMIYFRQEKFELAEFHFKKALEINSYSSVLYCYLGMVMHATKRYSEALKVYDQASQLDPHNPLVIFKQAKLLFTLEQYEDALEELEKLKEMTPKESAVYYLIGQIYKRMGQRQKAMIHFTWAYDLDPKGSVIIKEAIDASACSNNTFETFISHDNNDSTAGNNSGTAANDNSMEIVNNVD